MNYIHHLNNFYLQLDKDERLKALHISLYMALFQCWNYNHFPLVFNITRTRLMQTSRIGNKNTIRYYPSLHIGHLAKVTIIPFMDNKSGVPVLTSPGTNTGTAPVPVLTATGTKNGTTTMSKVVPIIKQLINNENNVCVAHTHNNQSKNNNLKQIPSPPSREEVIAWFTKRGVENENALAFFFHYSANGWMMGKHPIQDWEAAAEKWIINTVKKNRSWKDKLPPHK